MTAKDAERSIPLGLVLIPLTLVVCFAAGSNSRILDNPIVNFSAAPGQEIFVLCRQIGTPCGIEELEEKSFSKEARQAVTLTSTTAREVLVGFIGRYPAYSWQYADGVIEMRYKPSESDALKSPLETRIKHLVIKDRLSFHAVQDVLKHAGIKAGVSMSGDPRYGVVSLDLQDVTVREALNQIARADGKVAWQFAFSLTGKGYHYGLMSWHTDDGTPLFNWRQRKRIERKTK